MKIKYTSLELNWLPKSKDIGFPDIVIEPVQNCSGYYEKPRREEIEINGRFYDCENGLIVLNEYHDISPSTIAHEFRHHLQWMNGIEINSIWRIDTDYKTAIINYFTTYPIEKDALMYEVKHYSDDVNQLWLEWIITA